MEAKTEQKTASDTSVRVQGDVSQIPPFERADDVCYRWHHWYRGKWRATCWLAPTQAEAEALTKEPLYDLRGEPVVLVCERRSFVLANALL